MKINEILSYLESVCPGAYQESYDNCGLIVGDSEQTATGVLLCLDSTEDVLKEAVKLKCNMVIAHHPILFSPIKKITGKTYSERTILYAIKHDISIYAMHTNLDNIAEGVNKKIAEKIGLNNLRILLPKPFEIRNNTIGSGMVGELKKPLGEKEFLALLKKNMKTGSIRYTTVGSKKIKRVAVCGGAGSFLLRDVLNAQADAFVTADYKYHQFFDAEGKIMIADIGHYESEQFTPEIVLSLLNEKFPTFAALISKTNTNPVNYF